MPHPSLSPHFKILTRYTFHENERDVWLRIATLAGRDPMRMNLTVHSWNWQSAESSWIHCGDEGRQPSAETRLHHYKRTCEKKRNRLTITNCNRVAWQVSSAIDGNKETIRWSSWYNNLLFVVHLLFRSARHYQLSNRVGDPSYCYVLGSKYSQHLKCDLRRGQ